MRREQIGVRRIELTRNRNPLVRCTFPTEQGSGLRNDYSSCGEMIPHAPRRPCPSCGERQVAAQAPAPPPGALVIDDDAVIVDADTGHVVAVQIVRHRHLADLIGRALRGVRFDSPVTTRGTSTNEARLSGIVVVHRTFGYAPPVPLRRRYSCSRCRFDREHPSVMTRIETLCRVAERDFRVHAPEVYDETAEHVRDLIPDAWRITGTPWTSGIINSSAALPYHRDSGNVRGSWSAMLAAKRHVSGGLLHLADFNAWLAVPNGSISIFDGQSVLHGVTPFRLTRPDGYRYTLVTYAKSEMRHCSPDPADEARRAQAAATEATERALAKRRERSAAREGA